MKLFLIIVVAIIIGAVSGIAVFGSDIYRAGIVEGKRMVTVSNHEIVHAYVIEYCTPWFNDKRAGALMACTAP